METDKLISSKIFDLSDVCFNAEEPPFLRSFAKKHNLDFKEFESRYNELLHRAENHEISGRELWRILLEHYKLPLDIDEIIREMMSGKAAYQETLDLAKKLRRTCKTAFFTNYNEDYWKYIDERFNLKEYFDVGLVSYMIGARKPAVQGFKYLLEKLNVKPEEAIFIDDSTKNLENTQKLGIKTIQFKNVKKLSRDLRALGVNVE